MRRTTWVLLIIFIIVFGLAFFLEKNPGITAGLKTPTATTFPKLFPDIKTENIQTIELKTASASNSISLKRSSNNGWMFSDQQKPVDNGKVEELLSDLGSLQILAVMDSSLSKDDLGLFSPSSTLTYSDKDGKIQIIKIGKVTPTDSGYYIQLNNDAPVVASKTGVSAILDLFKVEALQLQTPTPTVIKELPIPKP